MKVALHHGRDIRIVDVEKETPKFYIVQGEKFKKVESPTPDYIAEGYGSGLFRYYNLSEAESPIAKEKSLWKKQRDITRAFMIAFGEKYANNLWNPQETINLTTEQAKHLNEYLNLGLELEE